MPTDSDEVDDLDRFRRYQETGERNLRNAIIERHQGLAYHLAGRHARKGVDLDDLRQVAVLGLVKAVERFDPERGVAFATFARHFVEGEIRHHFRDETWELHLPRSVKEAVIKVRHAVDEQRTSDGREPQVRDVAAVTGLTVDEVLEAMDAARVTRTKRFEAAAVESGSAEHMQPPVQEQGFDVVEYREALRTMFDEFDDRERQIVHGRFVEERSQAEIAEEIGISQAHVSRLLRHVLARLHQRLQEEQSPET